MTFPATVKDHDGSQLEKQWDSAERSIQNKAAFKSWGTTDVGVKKKSFRAQTKKLSPKDAAKIKIEDFFDPDEIRKMYQSLHIEVKSTPKAMQDKWTQLTKGDEDGKKVKGCNNEKRKVLALSLTHPMTWDTLVIEQWESLENKKKKTVKKDWKSWGEVCQQQGVAEATDWFRRNKYEIGEDKDGDTVYKKSSISEEIEVTKTKGGGYKKARHVDPNGDSADTFGQAISHGNFNF